MNDWTRTEEPNGVTCLSLAVPGAYNDAYPAARVLAYERLAQGGPDDALLSGPPAIVGRGDHVVIELRWQRPAAAMVVNVNVAGSIIDSAGMASAISEGLAALAAADSTPDFLRST